MLSLLGKLSLRELKLNPAGSLKMDLKVDRNYVLKFILDAVSLVVLGLPMLLLNTVATPYWRGFNCDDESIRYPYKESTIPNFLLYFYCFGIPLTAIIGIEIYNARRNLASDEEKRSFLWKLYCELVPFFFGVMVSQLITDTAKYSIGRLRPHFFQVCNPNVRCSITDPRADIYQYIERYRCMGLDQERIDDARKSFMSGHASFSAFCMTYTVFYLNHKVNKGLGLIKKLIQYILLLLAIYTGFTRISDYKHHWSDVLIGWLQGTVSAIVVCIYVAKLHKKREEKFYQPVTLIQESTDSVA